MFVFFKQKTSYEMRISDWSSDVCSSDLVGHGCFLQDNMDRSTALVHRLATQGKQIAGFAEVFGMADKQHSPWLEHPMDPLQHLPLRGRIEEIGRASSRERGCQYVKT